MSRLILWLVGKKFANFLPTNPDWLTNLRLSWQAALEASSLHLIDTRISWTL